MSKVKSSDWNKLLIDSQQIRANIGGDTFVSVKRGISDLDEASRKFNEKGKKNVKVDEALRLLARKNFDAEGLRRDLRSVHYMGESDAIQRLDQIDIESFLGHHHDTVIFSTINESRKASEQDYKFVQGRWAANEWSKAKRLFLENLGHKSVSWQSNEVSVDESQNAASSTQYADELFNPDTNKFVNEQHTMSKRIPGFLRSHIQIFRKLAVQSSLSSDKWNDPTVSNFVIRPALEVLNVLKSNENVAKDRSKSDLVNYATLLEILIDITHENGSLPHPPGYFSPISFSAVTERSNKLRVHLCYDLRLYFERQVLNIWHRKLVDIGAKFDSSHPSFTKKAISGGNNKQIIRSYVTYLQRSKLIPSHLQYTNQPTTISSISDEPISIWVYIYYYLRVGDFQSAFQELKASNSSGNYNVILSAILGLYKIQNIEINDSDDELGDDIFRSILSCRTLYNQEIVSDTRDHYKDLVLNLVSLCNQDALVESEILTDMESFLWANEWFQFFRSANDAMLNRGLGDSAAISMDLFSRILSYGGAEYYDKEGTSPFTYAIVLFACQRFGDAIEYLWKSKSLEAIHLMFICLHYGLILPHNALSCNPKHLMRSNQPYITSGFIKESQSENHDDVTPSSILLTYTNLNFNQYFPDVSVDYFALMNTSWRNHVSSSSGDGAIDSELYEAHNFKSHLNFFNGFKSLLSSLDRNQLAYVIGSCKDGKRAGLFVYFDNNSVKKLLTDLASDAKLHRKNSLDAIYILELADMLPEALNEICNELIKAMISHSNIELWRSTAIQFHEKYVLVSKNKTGKSSETDEEAARNRAKLSEILSSQKKEYLVSFLELLLELSLFFVNAKEKKWEEALKHLINLGLLPSNEDEAKQLVKTYRQYDEQLLRLIDEIFLTTSDCLRMHYEVLRSSGISKVFIGVVTDVDLKLSQLRNQAKALASLAEKLRNHLRRRDTEIILKRLAVDMA